MKRRGFTLLELVIVVIIVGILAAIGFVQYNKMIEKSRASEAKAVLGQIRRAEQAYYQENNAYTTTLGNLIVNASSTCNSAFYFKYSLSSTDATATRCSDAETGKSPGVPAASVYNLSIAFSDGTITEPSSY